MAYGFNADEIFQIAIEIEKNGRHFYEKASRLVNDSSIKELLSLLASEEAEHLKRFKELKAQLPSEAKDDASWDPGNEMNQYLKMMADLHVFRSSLDIENKLSKMKTSEDVLRLGIEFEKDSVVFFLAMQEVTEGKKGREYIGRIIDEERSHLKRLTVRLKRGLVCKI